MLAADRTSLLAAVQEEVALRVGNALSEGLTDAQFDEFESFLDGDVESARAWLDAHRAGWAEHRGFLLMWARSTDGGGDGSAAIAEWAGAEWLEATRPDYRAVVTKTVRMVRDEIVAHRDRLLAMTAPREGSARRHFDASRSTSSAPPSSAPA